jgi:KDO2-lipid IV(A) lauroyltransferase
MVDAITLARRAGRKAHDIRIATHLENSYWTKFLNQDTATLYGTEKYSKVYNYPVLFGTITKVKRGYYTFRFIEVESDPVNAPYGAITEKTTSLLEQEILKAPQYWLWTHRRWKHKKNTTDSIKASVERES